MPLVRINHAKKHLSPEMIEVCVSMVVGASGAVGALTGKGFGTGPADTGTITRSSAGVYVVTLPGRGSVQRIVPRAPIVEHATDVLFASCTAKSLTDRSATFKFWDGDTPAATDPSEGAIVHFVLDVQETTLG